MQDVYLSKQNIIDVSNNIRNSEDFPDPRKLATIIPLTIPNKNPLHLESYRPPSLYPQSLKE